MGNITFIQSNSIKLKNHVDNKLSQINFSQFIRNVKLQIQDIINSVPTLSSLDVFKYVLVILFCSLLGTSLVISPELKDGVFNGKRFYFIFSSYSLTLVASLQLFRKNDLSFLQRITWTDIFVVAHLIYISLNILFTEKAFLYSIRFVEYFFMTTVYFVGKELFQKSNRPQRSIIILAFLTFGFYQAFIGLQQLYGYEASNHSFYRVTGTFFNPAPFSGYLISIFPMGLAFYYFIPDKGIWNRILKYSGLITALTILLIIPSTLSRASWIALIVGAVIVYNRHLNFLYLFRTSLKTRTSRIAVMIVTIIMVISSAIGIFYWNDDSVLGRILIWRITLDMVKDKPIFGVGIDQYRPIFGHQQAAFFKAGEYTESEAMVAGIGEYAFNELLQITAEEGLIGLLLFLGIIFSAFKNPFSKIQNINEPQKALITGALGGLVAVLVFSLFSYPFSMTPLLLNFYIILSILSAFEKTKLSLYYTVFSYRVIKYLAFLCLTLFCYCVVSLQKEKYDAFKEWKIASRLKSYGDYNSAIETMEKIESVLGNNGDFMFDYGQVLVLNKDFLKGIEILEKASLLTSDSYLYNALGNCYKEIENYKKAEEAYIYAFYLIPHKFYPRYLLAKLYNEMGETQKALKTAHQIMNMKVKVPSTAIEEMKAEMEKLISRYK